MAKFLVFASTIIFAQAVFAVGFSSGTEYRARSVSGQLTVQCPADAGGFQVVVHTCRSTKLDPVEYDYFQGPQGINADKVLLTVSREDSSQRSKDSAYNSRTGRSEERFNLWVASLFQRPLLADGVNKVKYKMTLKGQAVTEGEFSVRVSRQPAATCDSQSIQSSDPNDCSSQYNVCGKYFEQASCN